MTATVQAHASVGTFGTQTALDGNRLELACLSLEDCFPELNAATVRACVQQAGGDLERAKQLLVRESRSRTASPTGHKAPAARKWWPPAHSALQLGANREPGSSAGSQHLHENGCSAAELSKALAPNPPGAAQDGIRNWGASAQTIAQLGYHAGHSNGIVVNGVDTVAHSALRQPQQAQLSMRPDSIELPTTQHAASGVGTAVGTFAAAAATATATAAAAALCKDDTADSEQLDDLLGLLAGTEDPTPFATPSKPPKPQQPVAVQSAYTPGSSHAAPSATAGVVATAAAARASTSPLPYSPLVVATAAATATAAAGTASAAAAQLVAGSAPVAGADTPTRPGALLPYSPLMGRYEPAFGRASLDVMDGSRQVVGQVAAPRCNGLAVVPGGGAGAGQGTNNGLNNTEHYYELLQIDDHMIKNTHIIDSTRIDSIAYKLDFDAASTSPGSSDSSTDVFIAGPPSIAPDNFGIGSGICTSTASGSAAVGASGAPGCVAVGAPLAPSCIGSDDDMPLVSKRLPAAAVAPMPQPAAPAVAAAKMTPDMPAAVPTKPEPWYTTQPEWLAQAQQHLAYAAVFLTQESKEVLSCMLPPCHPVVHTDHMTLAFRPNVQQLLEMPMGAEVQLAVIGWASNARVQVAAVDPPPWLPPTTSASSHITLSVAPGVPAFESGLLLRDVLQRVGLGAGDAGDAGDTSASAVEATGGVGEYQHLAEGLLVVGRVGVQLTGGDRVYCVEELSRHVTLGAELLAAYRARHGGRLGLVSGPVREMAPPGQIVNVFDSTPAAGSQTPQLQSDAPATTSIAAASATAASPLETVNAWLHDNSASAGWDGTAANAGWDGTTASVGWDGTTAAAGLAGVTADAGLTGVIANVGWDGTTADADSATWSSEVSNAVTHLPGATAATAPATAATAHGHTGSPTSSAMHQPSTLAPASLAGITSDPLAAERGANADVAFRSSVRVGDVWVVKPLDQLWSEDGAKESNIKWAVGRVAEHMLEDIYQPDGVLVRLEDDTIGYVIEPISKPLNPPPEPPSSDTTSETADSAPLSPASVTGLGGLGFSAGLAKQPSAAEAGRDRRLWEEWTELQRRHGEALCEAILEGCGHDFEAAIQEIKGQSQQQEQQQLQQEQQQGQQAYQQGASSPSKSVRSLGRSSASGRALAAPATRVPSPLPGTGASTFQQQQQQQGQLAPSSALQRLQMLFPDVPKDDVAAVLARRAGDVNAAAEALLAGERPRSDAAAAVAAYGDGSSSGAAVAASVFGGSGAAGFDAAGGMAGGQVASRAAVAAGAAASSFGAAGGAGGRGDTDGGTAARARALASLAGQDPAVVLGARKLLELYPMVSEGVVQALLADNRGDLVAAERELCQSLGLAKQHMATNSIWQQEPSSSISYRAGICAAGPSTSTGFGAQAAGAATFGSAAAGALPAEVVEALQGVSPGDRAVMLEAMGFGPQDLEAAATVPGQQLAATPAAGAAPVHQPAAHAAQQQQQQWHDQQQGWQEQQQGWQEQQQGWQEQQHQQGQQQQQQGQQQASTQQLAGSSLSPAEVAAMRAKAEREKNELRRQAKIKFDAAKVYLTAAQAAYAKRDRAAGDELSAKSRRFHAEGQQLNAEANAAAFKTHNYKLTSTISIDLHEMHLAPAMEKLIEHLQALPRMLTGNILLIVITGKGKHSPDGKPVIRTNVLKYLHEIGADYELDPANHGQVLVRIFGKGRGDGADAGAAGPSGTAAEGA